VSRHVDPRAAAAADDHGFQRAEESTVEDEGPAGRSREDVTTRNLGMVLERARQEQDGLCTSAVL
jgi:hypothetical protein